METSNIKRSFTLTLQGFNHLLWPAVCINCKDNICDSDNGLCQNCWNEILSCTGGDYCRRCGRQASDFARVDGSCPSCIGEDISFEKIARAGVYNGPLRNIILKFKNGRTELDKTLAFLADSALTGSGFNDQIELFVPVPLHWRRRLARGYNQSLVLAKKSKNLRAKISTDLVRMRWTNQQPVTASFKSRAANVKDAFGVRHGHEFTGRTICLIDDIKTSGATLSECARVLKAVGAKKVFALVLAVAGQTTD